MPWPETYVTSTADKSRDRRRTARLDALGRVRIVVRSRPLLALLRDINATGFTLEAALPVEVGESHRFELHLAGSQATVDATCVYCIPNTAGIEGTYQAGFAFDALEGAARTAVTSFIDYLASVAADGR